MAVYLLFFLRSTCLSCSAKPPPSFIDPHCGSHGSCGSRGSRSPLVNLSCDCPPGAPLRWSFGFSRVRGAGSGTQHRRCGELDGLAGDCAKVRPQSGERVLYKGPFKCGGARRSVFSNLRAMEGIANFPLVTTLAKSHQLCTVQLRLADPSGQRSGACLRPLCKDTPPLFLAERRRSPSQRVLRLPRNRGTRHCLPRHRSRYPPRMHMFAPGST